MDDKQFAEYLDQHAGLYMYEEVQRAGARVADRMCKLVAREVAERLAEKLVAEFMASPEGQAILKTTTPQPEGQGVEGQPGA